MDLRVDGVVEHQKDGITRNEDDFPPLARSQRGRGALRVYDVSGFALGLMVVLLGPASLQA